MDAERNAGLVLEVSFNFVLELLQRLLSFLRRTTVGRREVVLVAALGFAAVRDLTLKQGHEKRSAIDLDPRDQRVDVRGGHPEILQPLLLQRRDFKNLPLVVMSVLGAFGKFIDVIEDRIHALVGFNVGTLQGR